MVRGAVERLSSFGAASSTGAGGANALERVEMNQVKDKLALVMGTMESLATQHQSMEQKLINVQMTAASASAVPSSGYGSAVGPAHSLSPADPSACGMCGPTPPGLPSDSIKQIWSKLEAMSAGNMFEGACHCVHVTQLLKRVEQIEAKLSHGLPTT